MPFRATFRSSELKSEAAALALRKQKSEEFNHAMTQQLNYGKFLLASQQQANEQAMAEVKIKSDLKKQSEVSWALKEISNLDPTAPDYLGRYAGIMANAPMAADNKFLNEHFKEQAEVNRAAMAAKVAKEHIDYATDAAIYRHGVTKGMDIEAHRQQKEIDEASKAREGFVAAGIKSIDMSQFIKTDEEGNLTGIHDFAGIARGVANAMRNVPSRATIDKFAKVSGEIAEHQSKTAALQARAPEAGALAADKSKYATAYELADSKLKGALEEASSLAAQNPALLSGSVGISSGLIKAYMAKNQPQQQPAQQPQSQLGQQAQQPQPQAPAQQPQPSQAAPASRAAVQPAPQKSQAEQFMEGIQ